MNDQERRTSSGARPNFKSTTGKFRKLIIKDYLFRFSILSLLLALIVPFLWVPTGSAQGNPAFIHLVRVMESDETGLVRPAGLAFSSRANAFQVTEGQSASVDTELVKLSPFADRAGSARIAAAIKDPINVAFDNRAGRLLILHGAANQLLEVREDAQGNLDPRTLTRYHVRHLELQDPQGMAVDEASGYLYILDAAGPRIVQVELGAGGGIDGAVVSTIDVGSSGIGSPRGLAFEARTGNLHVGVPAEQKLVELTQRGELVAERDLSEFGLQDPQGMVFAPSGDQTDDPSQMSLFLADNGQSTGQIVELSLDQPVAAAAITFTSSLVRTADLSAISPPSPDPAGIAFLPNSNRLMVTDSEVEETVNKITHFQGANVWELTLSGSVVRTANISKVAPTVVLMTNEPTGVAWNPNNGHYYFTDDNAKKVFDLNPGADGLVGTSDDSWTQFDTLAAGNGDPEGITFDTWRNRLFVADGVNAEVYEYTLTGTLVNHFDVQAYGVQDPESVEFNPDSGTLFIMSSKRTSRIIIETTTSGALLQTIDFSAGNSRKAAGLAYAPASNGSGAKRFYIVDRGIDNDSDPRIIDGKMYEMTAPSSGTTPSPTPPTQTPTSGTGPPGKASLISPSGSINSPSPTYTWNKVSGATWYYLWVNGPSGNVIKQWYEASAVCGSNTCSATPATTLSSGTHTWWIQTWNAGGYGPWSNGMNFSLPPPPGAATLVSPNGSIGTNYTPTYTWNKVNTATWYYLWVNGPSGNVIKQWYEASAVCGSNICSVTPTTNLKAGNHTWWIQTWNAGGYGPWSNGMTFSVSPPGAATLVSPSGTITNSTPTYTWNKVNAATWYYLWVNGPSGNMIQKWYEASAICGASTCSVTPATTLSNGNHTWWVQTWNNAGYGPWSNAKNFTLTP